MSGKTKLFWILISLVVIQCSLSACAVVPYYSHYNVKADPYREPTPSAKAPSGAYLASEDVEWKVNWQCRDSWQFDRNVSSLNPLDACPKDDNNFIGVAISGGAAVPRSSPQRYCLSCNVTGSSNRSM